MAYSIDDAFSDIEIARQNRDAEALQRLELFMAELTETYIKDNYFALARLFWKLPYEQSVQLAHLVIERYLADNNLWSDVYLWGFSALRKVPMLDTVWTTRNYLAASLQALGQPERAMEILDENWRSLQLGSALAWEWKSGDDLSKAPWEKSEKKENEFLKFRADWLDLEQVEKVKNGVFQQLTADREKLDVSLPIIESHQGLTSFLLEGVDQLVAERGVERGNTLLGMTLATFEFLKLDDSEYLLGEAAKAQMRADHPSVAVEYLSIAAFLMNPAAYVPLAKILKDTGLVEQAMGYANVAVSKNIPGSADVVISLLGLDGVQMDTANQEMDEETKVTVYKLANGIH